MIGIFDADGLIYRAGFAAQKNAYLMLVDDKPIGVARTMREVTDKRGEYPAEASFRVEAKIEVEPAENAVHNLNSIIRSVADELGNPELRFYLSGPGNFRYSLATIQPYKGNRSPFAKPQHFDLLKRVLLEKYNATLAVGMEADDLVAIEATSLGKEAFLISNDKDLDMVPSIRYNWVSKKMWEVDQVSGYRSFYKQMLTGDTTDNIPGLPGIGEAKATKALAGIGNHKAMWKQVRNMYHEKYGSKYDGFRTTDEALLEIGRLLWIRRTIDEPLWEPPT